MIVLKKVDFANLAPTITNLFAVSGTDSFFSRAEWFELLQRYASKSDITWDLFVDDAHRAAFVCYGDKASLHGASSAYSMNYGPIVPERDSDATAAVRQLLKEIAAEKPSRSIIRFTALDNCNPCFEAMTQGLRSSGWTVRPFFDFGNWYEDTNELTFDEYFHRLPGSLKNTYRRKNRVMSHRVEYLYEDQAELETLIADYEEIYKNSWKPAEAYPPFIRQLIRFAAHVNALRMGVARIDGVPAAAQFWILWQGQATIYKLAHGQQYDGLSIGTILTMRLIERVLERDRPREIDFGRGDDPYKRLWLPKRRERWGLLAANPRTWAGLATSLRFCAAAIRDRFQAPGRQDSFGSTYPP